MPGATKALEAVEPAEVARAAGGVVAVGAAEVARSTGVLTFSILGKLFKLAF